MSILDRTVSCTVKLLLFLGLSLPGLYVVILSGFPLLACIGHREPPLQPYEAALWVVVLALGLAASWSASINGVSQHTYSCQR
jgi:hypothetical protein